MIVADQNTLIMAMEDGQKAFRVRHSKSMSERLAQVGEIVAAAKQTFELAGRLFRRFAQTSMEKDRLCDYLDLVYPRTEKQRKCNQVPEKWEHVFELLETDESLRQPETKGTLWAAYNAVTRYEDYKKIEARDEPERRLQSVWFGRSADIKLNAWNQARLLVT